MNSPDLMESCSRATLLSPFCGVALLFLVLASTQTVPAQQKSTGVSTNAKQTRPADELTKLRAEFVKATNEYKASLEKLQASYAGSVIQAEKRLVQSQALFDQGLISRNQLEAEQRAAAEAKDKVAEVSRRIGNADTQIAQALLEAEAESNLAKTRIPKGGILRTATYIRFNGGGAWALSDAWKVQRFFMETFRRPLPIAVFGQGAVHDRWRLDHRNSMDVSLHPDGPEGLSLTSYLRSLGIPFLAFRGAIPGTATGPHIHIGRPSHRY